MITLLNGEKWQESDLLKKMDDDSFYYGHLGQYALSSSSLKKLLESPNSYRDSLRKSDDTTALREGRLVHLAVLEKHKLDNLVVINRTRAAKEFKDAVAEHGDHMVVTQSEKDNAYWIAEAIHNNSEASYLLSDCDYEVPGVGMIQDLPFRAKADSITKDRSVIIDLKTTSAKVKDFRWTAKNFNYALQAKLYLKIFGAQEFIFLVINKFTKDIGIFNCSQEFLEYGASDIQDAISVYQKYFLQPNSKELIRDYVIRGVL